MARKCACPTISMSDGIIYSTLGNDVYEDPISSQLEYAFIHLFLSILWSINLIPPPTLQIRDTFQYLFRNLGNMKKPMEGNLEDQNTAGKRNHGKLWFRHEDRVIVTVCAVVPK